MLKAYQKILPGATDTYYYQKARKTLHAKSYAKLNFLKNSERHPLKY